MKKPHWFRPIDFFTMGIPAFMAIALLIYIAVVGSTDPNMPQAIAILITICVVTFVMFGIFSYQRKRWLDTFIWYPTYGFMVQPEAWLAYAPGLFDSTVIGVIEKWSTIVPNAGAVVRGDINWVYFKKDLDETVINPAQQKVKGLTIAGSRTIEVDYDKPSDPIGETAFAHELGHLIYGNATGNWNQQQHHEIMEAHGLL